jgi:PBSX family phage terminase large subunit
MAKTFSDPSVNQVLAIAGSNKPFNLWEGSIRSGKTFWSLIWLVDKIMNLPEGDGMLLGQTSETIERNYLLDFLSLMDSGNIQYSYVQRSHIDIEVYKEDTDESFTRRMWIVGAKDKGSIKRIRGSTLMIAYIDELTMMPKIAFDELVGRLSERESILLATTNPDSPHHWVLKDYVEHDEKKMDWARYTFIMDDNMSLSQEYKDRMKRQYAGIPARYQRMILGKWVMADGLIYQFDESKHMIHSLDQLGIKGPPMKYHVAGDYGTKNPTAFALIGQWPHPKPTREMKYIYVMVSEYYYNGRKTGIPKTTSAYLADFRSFIGQKRISTITLDPSASPLITEFEQAGLTVTPADNAVLDGIALVGNALANGYFYVMDTCIHTKEEFALYIWDEVASLKGIDRPIKENDHMMDAIRYFFNTHANPGKRGGTMGVSGW